jgi:acetyltransferase-like isoleucine patch superfamily enzyme
MIFVGIRHAIRTLRKLKVIDELRRRFPDATIEPGVVILGNPSRIKIGTGSHIHTGAIIDMSYGGELSIGRRCSIRSGAILAPHGGSIKIGDECGVQHYTILYGHGGLTTGDFVRFAAQSMVIPANHGTTLCDIPINKQPLSKKGIVMGSNIWVGSGVTITDGVNVADGAVIAAGSVVTRDVEGNSIVAGVPARFVKMRNSGQEDD